MGKKRKIIIAAGIWPPDVGGPATYGWNMAEKLVERGFKIGVVTYGEELKVEEDPSEIQDKFHGVKFKVIVVNRGQNKLIRFFLYFLRALKEARGAEVIYALDATAAGLPAALAAMILRKIFLIRVGGDLLWERAAESGFFEGSDKDFYESGSYLKYKPKLFKIIRFVLRRAEKILVPAQSLREIYVKFYGIEREKIGILPNVFEKKVVKGGEYSEAETEKKIIFAGRLVKHKNLERLIEVVNELKVNPSEIQDKFHGVKLKVKLVIVGEGPEEESLKFKVRSLPYEIPQSGNFTRDSKIISQGEKLESKVEFLGRVSREELRKIIRSSVMGVSVAWTEYNPNFILECLSLGKPVLISRENGLSVKLPGIFLANPFSREEIGEKIKNILGNLEEAKKEIEKLSFSYTWEDSVRDLIKVIL